VNVLGDITGRETVHLAAIGDTEFVYYVADNPKEELTPEEVLSGPDRDAWAAAMRAELLSIIQEHRVFSVEPIPPDNKALTLKWVLKQKRDGRKKGRLCVRGYRQRPGIDYNETFAPTAKMITLRVFLTLVACYMMYTTQLDVKTAFLYAAVAEQLFVLAPLGLTGDNPLGLPQDIAKRFCNVKNGHGLRLTKALYGLKQAPRNWFMTFDKFVCEEAGLARNKMDPCLYYKIHENGEKILLLLYVDDVLIASTSPKLAEELSSKLTRRFKVSMKGPLDVYLGIKIEHMRSECIVYLSQEDYIKEVCKKYGVSPDGTTDTPIQPNWYVNGEEERAQMSNADHAFVDSFPYRQIIGSCLYLAICTRVDIAYAVNYLARFMEAPTKSTCHAVKRLLRYLINTAKQRLKLGGVKKPYLRAFSDSDWAQCIETRRSTASILIFFGLGCILWISQRMKLVAKSAAEAEYCVLAPCADEITWLRALLEEINIVFEYATVMFVDNSAAIEIASNSIFHKKTKAIDIRAHAIREKNELGITAQEWIPSANNLADLNSKPVTVSVHKTLKHKIMDCEDLPFPTKRIKTQRHHLKGSLL
jgi:hypothetical protein